ncbi:RNA-directed DNA polymerase, eukaryota [Tanacetum coccineum]
MRMVAAHGLVSMARVSASVTHISGDTRARHRGGWWGGEWGGIDRMYCVDQEDMCVLGTLHNGSQTSRLGDLKGAVCTREERRSVEREREVSVGTRWGWRGEMRTGFVGDVEMLVHSAGGAVGSRRGANIGDWEEKEWEGKSSGDTDEFVVIRGKIGLLFVGEESRKVGPKTWAITCMGDNNLSDIIESQERRLLDSMNNAFCPLNHTRPRIKEAEKDCQEELCVKNRDVKRSNAPHDPTDKRHSFGTTWHACYYHARRKPGKSNFGQILTPITYSILLRESAIDYGPVPFDSGINVIDGVWKEQPNDVKQEFLSHFQDRFAKPSERRANIDMRFPKTISEDQSQDLEREVSKQEIKTAVWGCGTDKSPGPDGFSFGFYRHFWPVIEHDVYMAVNHFFIHGEIPPGCNSSFIALIPKVPDANLVKDFRPISLIGSIYKIIAKILSNRLVNVLGDIVNEVQSAFIAERQMLDGPFILNEILQWCTKKKKKTLIFKVDFEKAFDSIRWDFLDDVLKEFGFRCKWRNWIQSCLTSSKGSILVNGCPTNEFQFYKGLKQGDPLSPFLFILVMESLHLSFQRIVNAGMFKGIVLDQSLCLSHMFYADDAIFLGEWSDGNISTLIHVLKCFFHASGLKINLNKSKIMGINVESAQVIQAAAKLGCLVLKCPFYYLGTRVGGSMTRVQAWQEIVEKVKSRLSKWKSKTLSIGGRLTLLKSVLGSIPVFHMSIFKVPSKVLHILESIRSHFFNGHDPGSKKASWVKWNNVLTDKK